MALFLSTPESAPSAAAFKQSLDFESPIPTSLSLSLQLEEGIEAAAGAKRSDENTSTNTTNSDNSRSNVHDSCHHTPITVFLDGYDDENKTPLAPLVDLTASPSPVAAIPSSAEKRQTELEESEQLAWQLMQEESMSAYEMQVEYMRSNPELFSEEEVTALNMILQESQQEDRHGAHHNHREREEGEDDRSFDDENDEEEEGEGDGDDSADWTYERLLEIGALAGGQLASATTS
jgi:hypothetical protein